MFYFKTRPIKTEFDINTHVKCRYGDHRVCFNPIILPFLCLIIGKVKFIEGSEYRSNIRVYT